MNLIFDVDFSKDHNFLNLREKKKRKCLPCLETVSSEHSAVTLNYDYERFALMITADNLFNSSSKYNFSFVWSAHSQHIISESKHVS